MMGWNGGMMGYGIGMGIFGWLLQLVLFALVIWLIITLILRTAHHPDSESGSKAEAILKERFAKGEITEEEYEKMRAVLRH
jgi:Predicted membrane protein